jgi:hypothetical protein
MAEELEQKVLEERIANFKRASDILTLRYNSCDDNKIHLEPNTSENICNNCYRRLNYNVLSEDEEAHKRSLFLPFELTDELPQMQRPFDAPLRMQAFEKLRQYQKTNDYFNGVNKIISELKSGKIL